MRRLLSRACLAWLLGLLLLACRCGDGGADGDGPAVADDPRFLFGPAPTVTAEAPPAGLRPVPRTVAELDAVAAEATPWNPWLRLTDHVCLDRGDARAAVRDALLHADDPETLAHWYGDAIGTCPGRRVCPWLEGLAAEGGTLRAFALVAAASCPGPAVDALYAQEGVPPDAVLARATAWDLRTSVPPRALAAAIHAVARLVEGGERERLWSVRGALLALGEQDHEEVEPLLLALHAELRDPELRDYAALAMGRSTSGRAWELHRQVCASVLRDDLVCLRERGEVGYAAEGAPARSVEELAECARREDPANPWSAYGCLEELAGRSFARAKEVAPHTPSTWERTPAEALLHLVLARFSSAEAVRTELRAAGFPVGSGPLSFGDDHPVLPTEILEAEGLALAFDTETGSYPNAHDALLRSLAAMAPGAMDDVLFGEVAPPLESGLPYALHAWADGRHWVVSAEDRGDWYDVEAVVGLLNQVARERGRAVRFLLLPTDDQVATVVAGEPRSFDRLEARGLLPRPPAEEPAEEPEW